MNLDTGLYHLGTEPNSFLHLENGSECTHFVCWGWEWPKAQHFCWTKLAMFKLKTEVPEVQVCFVTK